MLELHEEKTPVRHEMRPWWSKRHAAAQKERRITLSLIWALVVYKLLESLSKIRILHWTYADDILVFAVPVQSGLWQAFAYKFVRVGINTL